MAKINNNFNNLNNKFKKSSKQEKYNVPINIEILDLMLQYTVTDNSLITKSSLLNILKFINYINVDYYENEYNIKLRIKILELMLRLQLEHNISNYTMIKEEISSRLASYIKDVKEIFNMLDHTTSLSNDEISFINEYIGERLVNIYLFKYKPELEKYMAELDLKSSVSSIESVTTGFEAIIEKLYMDMKTTRASCKASALDFSLSDMSLSSTVAYTIKELNKPCHKMVTGIKKLNDMLGGGFELGRVYLILGLPKGFKSGTLLNIAIWGVKYNKNITTNDPNKKPCVLYLTMENSIRETLQRMFNYSTADNIKHYTEEEASRIIRDEFLFDNDIDFVVKYKPNMSISTMDLDGILNELESQGKECVMVVQDYAKRIRPNIFTGDKRLDLGEVINDFSVIAKQRNIIIVTASQLNREAMKVVEASKARNRQDLGKELASSHVGESTLMIENTDYAFIVYKENDISTNRDYLTFKMIASRSENEVGYFAHPFEDGNSFKLVEDVNDMKSASIERIGDGFKDFNPNKFAQNNNPTEKDNNPNNKIPRGLFNAKSSTKNKIPSDDQAEIDF